MKLELKAYVGEDCRYGHPEHRREIYVWQLMAAWLAGRHRVLG